MACGGCWSGCSTENPAAIRSVIPGVIRPVRDAKGEVKIRVTVPTTNGWKAIALSAGARQELFISTNLSKDQLEQAIRQASGARTETGGLQWTVDGRY